MARSRAKLQPWIENMIINYETDKEKNIANLKAHVVAVGEMPQSQALGAEGRPELLFLSDGAVQIPAIVTDTAWEHLQEEEERECFSSLVNTTVCLQTYSLRFHMAPEKTKSRFFLSLSKLAAMAAGSVKECSPCCTTLPSVRLKICDTWKALRDQNLSQTESSGVDLSELLGVWQYDCLVDLVEEVRERLTAARSSTTPQPSTSRVLPARPKGTRTKWDIDRVRCKRSEPFSVPVAHLIIPDPVAPPPKPTTQPEEGSPTLSGLIPPSGDQLVMHSTPAAPPHAPTRGNGAQDVVSGCGFGKTTPPPREPVLYICEAMLLEEEEMDNKRANPWNAFPPPSKVFCTSSSSEASPGLKAAVAVNGARAPRGGPDHDVSPGVVEPSEGDQSLLPPYQNPAPLHSSRVSPASTKSSPPNRTTPAEPITVLSSGEEYTGIVEKEVEEEAGGAGSGPEEADPTTSSAGARRATHGRPGAAARPERGGTPREDLSPPSWLFESQPGGSVGEAGRGGAERAGSSGSRCRPAVHRDGSRFTYRYEVSLRNVLDLSRFRVADDQLHWAVKYLVAPKHADGSDTEVS